jgi:hypothetical protein
MFIAPHGAMCDDANTSIVARKAAEALGGYAVINNGFERADKVNLKLEKANCNNIEHCYHDVVKEEFLEPILRFKKRMLRDNQFAYIFNIHGVSDNVRKKADDLGLGYIVGWGAGKPPSHTCDKWRKDAFVHFLSVSESYNVYEAKAGSNYSGWKKNNLNQFFRKWQKDNNVHSMQLEIIHELRNTEDRAETTGNVLALCIEELLRQTEWEPGLFSNYI